MTTTNTELPKYLVVWRGEDEVIQSAVRTADDPNTLSNNDWVKLAILSEYHALDETLDEADEADAIIEGGYDVYLVCPFPSAFYES